MKTTQPKIGLVFIVILILVFTVTLSPWWVSWGQDTVAQIDQDRRVAASEHVWCYTHMLDTVTGHPPELTQEEIIAYNPYPWSTDTSIADTRDRTDCFESWQEAWDGTDPMLQNTFAGFLPENPTEEDYARILPLNGEELLMIEMDKIAAMQTQVASGEVSKEELVATATAQAFQQPNRFNEEGAVWCVTLLHIPANPETGRDAYGQYVGHDPGVTIDGFITRRHINPAPIMQVTEFQRVCHPTYREAGEFIASFSSWGAGDVEGLTTEDEYKEKLAWTRVGGTGYSLHERAEYRAAIKTFKPYGEPIPITLEVDEEMMATIQKQAAEESHQREVAAEEIHQKSIARAESFKTRMASGGIVWCETLLRTGSEEESWALVGHSDTQLAATELAALANSNPDTAGDYITYDKDCFYNYVEAARKLGRLLQREDMIKASDLGKVDPAIAQSAVESLHQSHPALPIIPGNHPLIKSYFPNTSSIGD